MDRDAQIIGSLSRGKIEPGAQIGKAQAERRAGIFWGLGFGLGFHLQGFKKAREIVPGLREWVRVKDRENAPPEGPK